MIDRILLACGLLFLTFAAMGFAPPGAKIGVGIGCIVISYGVMRMAAAR